MKQNKKAYEFQYIQQLFEKFLSGDINEYDRKNLDYWYNKSKERTFFSDNMNYSQDDVRIKMLAQIHRELEIESSGNK